MVRKSRKSYPHLLELAHSKHVTLVVHRAFLLRRYIVIVADGVLRAVAIELGRNNHVLIHISECTLAGIHNPGLIGGKKT